MNKTEWLGTVAVAAVVATACSSSHPSATGPKPTPTARVCAAVQPVPRFAATPPSNRNLVLGKLSGSDRTVVRDVTDATHPKTLGTFDLPQTRPRFVSATDVSYVDQDGKLIRLAFSSSSITVVAACAGQFDWNADGSAVVYTTQSDSGASLHQLSAGHDMAIGTLPMESAVGCESQSCADGWDSRLSYSPDGASISLLRNISSFVFRIWTSDGRLVKTFDSQLATMSAWSGKSLYFRDDKGVEVWRDGAISLFLPGVAWIRPKASPSGGQIAYEARDSAGLAHVYVVDTGTAKVRDLGKGRAEPVFITSSWIWYEGERLCISGDQCPVAPTILTGKTYIYDLQDSSETESRITTVYDVWPHPA